METVLSFIFPFTSIVTNLFGFPTNRLSCMSAALGLFVSLLNRLLNPLRLDATLRRYSQERLGSTTSHIHPQTHHFLLKSCWDRSLHAAASPGGSASHALLGRRIVPRETEKVDDGNCSPAPRSVMETAAFRRSELCPEGWSFRRTREEHGKIGTSLPLGGWRITAAFMTLYLLVGRVTATPPCEWGLQGSA